jgi:hypothetical protein
MVRSQAEDETKQLSQKAKAVVMRRYRAKLKAKMDDISKHETELAERIMKVKRIAHNEGTDIESDDWGKDIGVEFDRKRDDLGIKPQSNKPKEQFEEEHESGLMGANAWSSEPNEPVKPKRSLQDILRELDNKHSQ